MTNHGWVKIIMSLHFILFSQRFCSDTLNIDSFDPVQPETLVEPTRPLPALQPSARRRPPVPL